ncbi:DUF1801 domain-containing protein [Winogradskyella sp. MH6]|uniref:DUF1801 domain-containing protein n=1 Tax=Winogradskyella sp. MH6 TaxID=2929510 RepID=UPI001FB1AF4F|nr:DUF1801 domain-containing protein [Winogradskyella sp. MH6]
MNKLNVEVSKFLDGLNHPLRDEIENLRHIITNATNGLTENIKWNGPNYCYNDNDRITMKIQPPKQIQLIFHRGAKKQEQPEDRIIQSKSKLLLWKENDRAIITFKNRFEIEKAKADLSSIVNEWILRAK